VLEAEVEQGVPRHPADSAQYGGGSVAHGSSPFTLGMEADFSGD